MSYELPPDLRETIQQHIASGRYSSEEDVLRAAFVALASHDREVTAIQAGLDDMEAGRVRPFASVDAEIRKRVGFSDEQ